MLDVIVDEFTFFINDYDGKDYKVNVYAQDVDESDMYTILVNELKDSRWERVTSLYVDSCGNIEGEEAQKMKNDKLLDEIYNILFIKQQHGVIRGF